MLLPLKDRKQLDVQRIEGAVVSCKYMVIFAENFKNDKHVVFSKPFVELCSHNVIVETCEAGTHIGTLIQNVDSMPVKQRKIMPTVASKCC